MRGPNGTAHKNATPLAATQFFHIQRECKDGECVFTEVKTTSPLEETIELHRRSIIPYFPCIRNSHFVLKTYLLSVEIALSLRCCKNSATARNAGFYRAQCPGKFVWMYEFAGAIA